MNQLPTANDILSKKFNELRSSFTLKDVEECMIEFAKLHCEAQQEAILEKVKLKHDYHDDVYDSNYCDKVEAEFCSLRTDGDGVPYAADLINVNKDSILNAYPLKNIK